MIDKLLLLILSIVVPLGMFLLGLQTNINELKKVISKPKAILIGIFCQIMVVPLLAFLFSMLYPLPAPLLLGVIILSAVPGGAVSNIISFLSKGSISLSISLTIISSLITVFTIPLVVNLGLMHIGFDQVTSLPVIPTIIRSILLVALPVTIGIFTRERFPGFSGKMERPTKIVSLVLLIVAVSFAITNNIEYFIKHVEVKLLFGVIGYNLMVMFAGFLLAYLFRLERASAFTISIEAGIQNSLLALLVVELVLVPEAIVFPAFYAFLSIVFGFLWGLLFRYYQKNKVT